MSNYNRSSSYEFTTKSFYTKPFTGTISTIPTGSSTEVNDLVGELQDNGCKNFIYTDIEKDGTLSHPNFKYISNLRSICKSELYIAGGISDINDITKLKNIGIDGAILGMSIYTGKIDLKNLLNQE